MTMYDFTDHTATVRQQKTALEAMATAYTRADRDIKMLKRNSQLYPGEKTQREKEIRDRLSTELHQANTALTDAQKAARRLSKRGPEAPSAEAMQRRSYFAEQAKRDLDGLDASAAVTVLKKVVDSGDRERAQEYARTARATVEGNPEYSGQWKRLSNSVEPEEGRLARHWDKTCDQLEQRVALSRDMNRWDDLGTAVGAVDPNAAQEQPINVRSIQLLAQNLEGEAVKFHQGTVAADGGDDE